MRVAVIGAGAAGLVTIRELRRAQIECVAFEANAELGGTWVYTDEVAPNPLGCDQGGAPILSSLYASLRTNVPRDLMAFRDYPFDTVHGDGIDSRRFPGHPAVLQYIRNFARDFELVPSIRLESYVTRIERTRRGNAPTNWVVESRQGDATHTEPFDAIAICNGHYTKPHVPTLPGTESFAGTLMHSHNYRHPAPFAGKRVVLLGAKSSGVDLSLELSTVARDVYACARNVDERTRPSEASEFCARRETRCSSRGWVDDR